MKTVKEKKTKTPASTANESKQPSNKMTTNKSKQQSNKASLISSWSGSEGLIGADAEEEQPANEVNMAAGQSSSSKFTIDLPLSVRTKKLPSVRTQQQQRTAAVVRQDLEIQKTGGRQMDKPSGDLIGQAPMLVDESDECVESEEEDDSSNSNSSTEGMNSDSDEEEKPNSTRRRVASSKRESSPRKRSRTTIDAEMDDMEVATMRQNENNMMTGGSAVAAAVGVQRKLKKNERGWDLEITTVNEVNGTTIQYRVDTMKGCLIALVPPSSTNSATASDNRSSTKETSSLSNTSSKLLDKPSGLTTKVSLSILLDHLTHDNVHTVAGFVQRLQYTQVLGGFLAAVKRKCRSSQWIRASREHIQSLQTVTASSGGMKMSSSSSSSSLSGRDKHATTSLKGDDDDSHFSSILRILPDGLMAEMTLLVSLMVAILTDSVSMSTKHAQHKTSHERRQGQWLLMGALKDATIAMLRQRSSLPLTAVFDGTLSTPAAPLHSIKSGSSKHKINYGIYIYDGYPNPL